MNQLSYAFQRRPAQAATDFDELSRTYVARTIERLSSDVDGVVHRLAQRHAELSSRADLYRWLAGALGRNPNPGNRANNSRLIELLVALDLSDGGTRAGPLYWGWFQQTPNVNQIQDYRDWFAQQSRALAANRPETAWLAQHKRPRR